MNQRNQVIDSHRFNQKRGQRQDSFNQDSNGRADHQYSRNEQFNQDHYDPDRQDNYRQQNYQDRGPRSNYEYDAQGNNYREQENFSHQDELSRRRNSRPGANSGYDERIDQRFYAQNERQDLYANRGRQFASEYPPSNGNLTARDANYASDPYAPSNRSSANAIGFRGKGPKGYKRSDERLQEQINERLMDDDAIDASEISVEVKQGKITLEGSVNQRRIKHQIEDLVEQIAGSDEIDNRIIVKRFGNADDTRRGSESTRAGSESNQGSATLVAGMKRR